MYKILLKILPQLMKTTPFQKKINKIVQVVISLQPTPFLAMALATPFFFSWDLATTYITSQPVVRLQQVEE